MTAIGKVMQNLAEQLIQARDVDPCALSFTQHLNSKFPHYSHKKVSASPVTSKTSTQLRSHHRSTTYCLLH